MKIIFLTYSDKNYEKAKEFAVYMAKRIGNFDKIIAMSPSDLDKKFIETNKNILSNRRGAGLWLWKPYIVSKVLSSLNDNDYLFYADSGCFVIRDITKIIKNMNEDIWCCEVPLIEKEFTKKECFTKMKCIGNRYENTPQRIATFFCIKKTPNSIRFINEWLYYCQMPELILPCENIPPLISHREDQSIFSLLTKKYNINAHIQPTIEGKHPKMQIYKNATYIELESKMDCPICLIVHKKKIVTWILLLKKIIMLLVPSFIISIYAEIKFIINKRYYKRIITNE